MSKVCEISKEDIRRTQAAYDYVYELISRKYRKLTPEAVENMTEFLLGQVTEIATKFGADISTLMDSAYR